MVSRVRERVNKAKVKPTDSDQFKSKETHDAKEEPNKDESSGGEEEPQEEELGAQALLQLGTKGKKGKKNKKPSVKTELKKPQDSTTAEKDDDINATVDESEHIELPEAPIDDVSLNVADLTHTGSGDSKEEEHDINVPDVEEDNHVQQDTNETVEAAVMRYVGGTLDDNSTSGSSDRKRKNYESIDFPNWSFLDDNLDTGANETSGSASGGKNGRTNDDGNTEELARFDVNVFDQSSTKQSNPLPLKKKRRNNNGKSSNSDSHYISNVSNVDPELAQMDGTSNSALAAAAYNRSIQFYDPDQTSAKAEPSHSNIQPDPQQVAVEATNLEHDSHHPHEGIHGAWPTASHANLVAGRAFTKQEISLIDDVISQYCDMHNLTRHQVCQRIWANDRKKDDFWETLLRVLPNRTRSSVYKHVRRAYHIFDVRGKWTPPEDQQLGALVAEKSSQWKTIGEIMGRMPEDCRDRWRNYVKCGSNRTSNKWSLDEENSLRQVVSELKSLDPTSPINWTLVSERMGGTRSRIQCRYKWNKFIKKAAANKVEELSTNEKFGLVSRLKSLNYDYENQIDWEVVASMDSRMIWSANHLRAAFEKSRNGVKDYKKKSLVEILNQLQTDLFTNNEVFSHNDVVIGVDEFDRAIREHEHQQQHEQQQQHHQQQHHQQQHEQDQQDQENGQSELQHNDGETSDLEKNERNRVAAAAIAAAATGTTHLDVGESMNW